MPKKLAKKLPDPLIDRLIARKYVKFLVLWIVFYLLLLSFFFRTVLRNHSYIEIFPREFIAPMLMHAVTALLITASLFWTRWFKGYFGKLIAGVVFTLFMIGYDGNLLAVSGIIRSFTPALSAADPLPVVSALYLILLFVISILLGVFGEKIVLNSRRTKMKDVRLGIFVLSAYLFLVPAFGIAKIFPAMLRESNVQAPEFKKDSKNNNSTEKPDIFYIVLDRYTNDTVLKQQFNFDNSTFTTFLKENDFTVNSNALSSYPFTTMSVSSTMSANYTKDIVKPFTESDVQTRSLYHNLIWQSSVVKALKNEGYEYHAIGSRYAATYKAPLADVDYRWEHQLSIFGVKKRLRGIESNEFKQSPYYRFSQMQGISWWPISSAEKDTVSEVREQLTILKDLSTTKESGGRLIFAHILVPHDPFYINADGSLSSNPSSDNVGKPVKEKYIGQVEFINSQMKDLIAAIQKQSNGKAVIILNADEGPYPQTMNNTFMNPTSESDTSETSITNRESMSSWSDEWLQMKFGILQAVHIPKATTEDMFSLSSVNAFRIVLNRYAGYNLSYLPTCQFGLIEGNYLKEYIYTDITARFTSDPPKDCKSFMTANEK